MEDQGWETTVTPSTRDRGVDVIASRGSHSSELVLIQAKCYGPKTKVSSGEIQKASGLFRRDEPVDGVIVVTSTSFTTEAEAVASARGVQLVDGGELASLINSGRSQRSRRSLKKTGYTKPTPWRIECPCCDAMICDSEESFIEHWALSTSCNFDPANEDVSEVVDLSAAELQNKIKSIKTRRNRSRSKSNTPPMDCPFCRANLERSTEAFVNHFTGSDCDIDAIDQIPANRPSEIPVDIWWELKEKAGIRGIYETKRGRHHRRNVRSGARDAAHGPVEQGGAGRPDADVAESQSLTDKILALLGR